MVNLSNITQAVTNILMVAHPNYLVTRNAMINYDPNNARVAWVGVYRGSLEYSPHTVGKSQPWIAQATVEVVIQCASMKNGMEAEDNLQTAEDAIVGTLDQNRKLEGYVNNTIGYNIRYEFNNENNIYFHAAIIEIVCQVRS